MVRDVPLIYSAMMIMTNSCVSQHQHEAAKLKELLKVAPDGRKNRYRPDSRNIYSKIIAPCSKIKRHKLLSTTPTHTCNHYVLSKFITQAVKSCNSRKTKADHVFYKWANIGRIGYATTRNSRRLFGKIEKYFHESHNTPVFVWGFSIVRRHLFCCVDNPCELIS